MIPNYGERLSRAREKAGVSQDDLGAAIGKSGSTIRSYEDNGGRWWRRPAIVEKLSKRLDISPEVLIGESDPQHQPGQPIGPELASLLLDLLEDPKASDAHKRAARQTIEIALGLTRPGIFT